MVNEIDCIPFGYMAQTITKTVDNGSVSEGVNIDSTQHWKRFLRKALRDSPQHWKRFLRTRFQESMETLLRKCSPKALEFIFLLTSRSSPAVIFRKKIQATSLHVHLYVRKYTKTMSGISTSFLGNPERRRTDCPCFHLTFPNIFSGKIQKSGRLQWHPWRSLRYPS